ncbi:MAG TPA: TIGR02302 family protein [Geminicoccaceae bacterium]|nr:TIGR02302 family protein [Geminicoccus sp.]HMU50204.1 TIGR02302 family protein [Geminicoccaceae bacterium]
MRATPTDPRRTKAFRARVFGARWAVAFERIWPAAWPLLAVAGLFLAVSWLGIWQRLPLWLHGAGLVGFALAAMFTSARLLPALRWPSRDEALARIERDSGVRHQPLRALEDALPSELADPRTRRLWEAHRRRLLGGLDRLKLAAPRSDLPRRDPWALRAALLLLVAVSLVDAGGLAGKRLADAFRLGRSAAAAVTPLSVSLWITPPAYTGRPPKGVEAPPPRSAADEADAPPRQPLVVPAGSVALAQLHHLPAQAQAEVPQLALDDAETAFEWLGGGSAEARLSLDKDGSLAIRLADGTEMAHWIVDAVPDQPPTVSFVDPPKPTLRGVLRFNYLAEDDYGVVDLGVLLAPSGRDDETERLALAKPTGQQPRLASGSYLDLTAHPLAGLPVTMRLEAIDSVGQVGRSDPLELILPERAFKHPLARAVIEQRKTLMSSPQRQREVSVRLGLLAETELAQRLGAPVELGLRSGSARLDHVEPGPEGAEGRRSVAQLLWDLALYIEDGALSVAERDLRSLQEQLEKALTEGADDAELEQLMAELEQAMQRFLDELTRQAMENAQRGDQQQMPLDDGRMVTRQDLQRMLDRAREMMRSGARDAAQQMLSQLREMLENLQAMAGQQQASPQQRALSDLQKMIQLQRDLLERSFRMQRQQQGQQGRQQQGQEQQQGQQGEGQQGEGQPQDGMGQAAGEQEALRRALGELMRRLGEQGMEIPRSLGQAELEMRGARDALQGEQPGQAAEDQGQALDQMQQAGQALMEQLQQQMANQPGQQPGPGQMPQGQQRTGRDPLGRSVRNEGGWDTNGELVPEESELGRARGVLEELYRRSGERARPQLELDYYNRLLDRF